MDERVNAALARNDKVIRVIHLQKQVLQIQDLPFLGGELSIHYLPAMAELRYEIGKAKKETILQAKRILESEGYVAKRVYYITESKVVTTERVNQCSEDPWDV